MQVVRRVVPAGLLVIAAALLPWACGTGSTDGKSATGSATGSGASSPGSGGTAAGPGAGGQGPSATGGGAGGAGPAASGGTGGIALGGPRKVAGESGGCSCDTVGRAGAHDLFWLAAALGLALGRRRPRCTGRGSVRR